MGRFLSIFVGEGISIMILKFYLNTLKFAYALSWLPEVFLILTAKKVQSIYYCM